ncbi:MAG: thioredoxin family protein [Acholeplasmataceae bacterium]|jgi:thiol-disulfide isomerase/thioredoxin
MLTYLTNLNYNREVLLNKKRIVLLFIAPWCLACQEILPLYEEWAKEYSDRYDFKLVDITKNKYLVKKFDVVSTLTFIIIENRNIINRFAGMQTSDTFKFFLSNK